jgi:coniferyl-aldehyde dehydrogenase
MRRIFLQQAAAFRKDPFPSAEERRENLHRLLDAVRARRSQLTAAVDRDFGGRAEEETSLAEILLAVNAARYAARRVARWMKPRGRHLTWLLQPARAWVQPQPLGVVGIVVPWNYPILLTITPLICALAAGNRVMLKLSEHAPETAEALRELIESIFDHDLVGVVTGGAEMGHKFTAMPFNHLLFTGSTLLGRWALRSAAENLTPVTLELGGKSPAIVAPDARLERAAEDIVYGKLLNAGQTCIAPDYVLAPRESIEQFAAQAASAAQRLFGAGMTTVRDRERMAGMLEEARAAGVREVPLAGGAMALIDPPEKLRVMREEIFCPILPLKPYDSLQQALDYVNSKPRPLALYLFSRDSTTIDTVMRQTISGAICVNDTLSHIAADNLPFGGVGLSGMGHYHGREGFDTFSKLKPVLARRWPGLGSLLRPPYTGRHRKLLRWLIGG